MAKKERQTLSTEDVQAVSAEDLVRPEPRIVAAVASMASVASWGENRGLAQALEGAMVEAVKQCSAEGISMDHPDLIRRRMLEARADVMEQFRQSELAATRKGNP